MLEVEEDEFKEQKSLFGVITNEDAVMELEELRQAKSLFDPELEETEMQTLGLGDESEKEKQKGFWRRQFQAESTRRQNQYDWIFGVIMPVVCIFFDPIVFRSFFERDGGVLGAYRPFGYTASFISIILMIGWLLWRQKLGGLAAPLAGLFFAASIVSLAIGTVLVPFSLLGIAFCFIGLLGFTPFFTSIIFLRNGVRALRAAKPGIARRTLVYTSILGGLWALTVPYAMNAEVNRSLELISKGTPETIRAQGLKLRLLTPLVDANQLREIYWNVPKGSREAEEIERLYLQLTGKSIKSY